MNRETEKVAGVVWNPHRPSFGDCRLAAARQVEAEEYGKKDQAMWQAVTSVMAEIYMLDDAVELDVEGTRLRAAQIKEIYRLITPDVVIGVIRRMRQLPKDLIRNVKKYLRTALYNAVLCGDAEDELDAEIFYRRGG